MAQSSAMGKITTDDFKAAPNAATLDPLLATRSAEVTTLGDMLLNTSLRVPDKLALVFEGRPRVTWGQLGDRVLQRARALVALGVKRGDHVGLLLPSNHEFIEMLFATAWVGATGVLLNARYRSHELQYVVENADLAAVVSCVSQNEHVDFAARLNAAFPDLASQADVRALKLDAAPKLRSIVLLGDGATPPGFVTEKEFMSAGRDVDPNEVHLRRVAVRLRDIFMIMYTSGTSANPKGCLISQEAIARETAVLGRQWWLLSETDTVWSPLPLFHIAALLGMLSMVDVGGTFVGQEHFDPALSIRQIVDEGATMLFVPFVTFLQAMLYEPAFEKADFSKVRLTNTCFAAQPESVGQAYAKAMPNARHCGTYGMTEVSGIATTGNWQMDPKKGFTKLGLPLPGVEIKIVDRETGVELPVNGRGEILVRGFSLLENYYKDPAKTAESFEPDGWFHTGDVGSVDEEGHLMFHGRTKDMLKVGGENVAAAEVEAMLARHDAVKLAQVVGLPDARLAEIPAAYVELAPGATATEVELIEFCKPLMAGFKVPRHIRFIDEWPMSASKIQKFKLRQALIDELGLE